MLKKIVILCTAILVSMSVYGFDIGISLGTMNKTPDGAGMHYGLTGVTGLFVPMLKLEIGYYHRFSPDDPAGGSDHTRNAVSLGVKFRPKFGKISPYGVVGIGTEFDRFGVDFGEYNNFAFFGGGIHFYLMDIMSLRGDIRLLSFSGENRFCVSGGFFIHI